MAASTEACDLNRYPGDRDDLGRNGLIADSLSGDRYQEAHGAEERQETEHPADDQPEIAPGDRHRCPPTLVSSAILVRRPLVQLTIVDGPGLVPLDHHRCRGPRSGVGLIAFCRVKSDELPGEGCVDGSGGCHGMTPQATVSAARRQGPSLISNVAADD